MGNLPVKPVIPSMLEEFAGPINEYYHAAESTAKTAVLYARASGELLVYAKDRCKYGAWLPWLKENFDGSVKTAERYMSLASDLSFDTINKMGADLSINGALRAIEEKKNGGKPKPIKKASTKAKAKSKAKQDADEDAQEPLDADEVETDETETDGESSDETEDETEDDFDDEGAEESEGNETDEVEGEFVEDEDTEDEVDEDETDEAEAGSDVIDGEVGEPIQSGSFIINPNGTFEHVEEQTVDTTELEPTAAELEELYAISHGLLTNIKKGAPTVDVPMHLIYDLVSIVKPEEVETVKVGTGALKALVNAVGSRIGKEVIK